MSNLYGEASRSGAGETAAASIEAGAVARGAAFSEVSFFDQPSDPRIYGLLSTYKWSGTEITYSDPDSRSDYETDYGENFTDLVQISAAQLRVAQAALDTARLGQPTGGAGFSVEGFTGLSLRYAGHGSGDATIRLVNTSDPETAYAYMPSHFVGAGDVFYGQSGREPVTGNYDYLTMIHEIGHALGLKHGHEDTDFGALPADWDSMEFSVMTYRSYIGGPTDGYTNEEFGYAQTYMMLDIAALQSLYGADYSTNAGDTVYTWDPLTGEARVNGVVALTPGANRVFETIWDGGGSDTYDLSSYTTNLRIDLKAGGYSTFSATQLAYLGGGPNSGYARGNVFNALMHDDDPRSLIERAVGGSGNDIMIGNSLRNGLTGGLGNDRLNGAEGNDRLFAGGGNDNLRGGDGNDRLMGGFGADVLIGGRGADIFDFHRFEESTALSRDTLRAGDGGLAFDGAGAAAGDRFDLQDIDANQSIAGNQAFSFGGGTGIGKVWATTSGTDTLIRANVDGHGAFDFEVRIEDGTVLASAYGASDFIL